MRLVAAVLGSGPAVWSSAAALEQSGLFDVHSTVDLDDHPPLGRSELIRHRVRRILEADRLHLVLLCAPHAERMTLGRAALEAGKSVLLDEPPPLSVAEFEALTALARRGTGRLGMLPAPGVLLEEGPITAPWSRRATGTLHVSQFRPAEAYRASFWPFGAAARAPGTAVQPANAGSVRALAPYLDLACRLLGAPVAALTKGIEQGRITGVLHFASGAQLALAATSDSPVHRADLSLLDVHRRLVLDGTRLHYSDDRHSQSLTLSSGPALLQAGLEDMARSITHGCEPVHCAVTFGHGLSRALELLRLTP
ncbi:hypothetical protein ACFY2V_36645 [Streptomyces eurythermus]|uniref:Uncharacterized protein n=1 Tax=Streptomyces flaveolus TaxID=67297 RepID=A0ABV3AF24_9ACTN